ncbi:MAG: hypothetical protein AABY07_04475 [Nanoarchaeota archaeon]
MKRLTIFVVVTILIAFFVQVLERSDISIKDFISGRAARTIEKEEKQQYDEILSAFGYSEEDIERINGMQNNDPGMAMLSAVKKPVKIEESKDKNFEFYNE